MGQLLTDDDGTAQFLIHHGPGQFIEGFRGFFAVVEFRAGHIVVRDGFDGGADRPCQSAFRSGTGFFLGDLAVLAFARGCGAEVLAVRIVFLSRAVFDDFDFALGLDDVFVLFATSREHSQTEGQARKGQCGGAGHGNGVEGFCCLEYSNIVPNSSLQALKQRGTLIFFKGLCCIGQGQLKGRFRIELHAFDTVDPNLLYHASAGIFQ